MLTYLPHSTCMGAIQHPKHNTSMLKNTPVGPYAKWLLNLDRCHHSSPAPVPIVPIVLPSIVTARGLLLLLVSYLRCRGHLRG